MKQFNEEYKEYLKEEAPDLWDRIEAGLDMDGRKADSSGKKTVDIGKGREKRGSRVRVMRLAASIAACVAALILVLPVYRLISGNHPAGLDGEAPQAERLAMDDAAASVTEDRGMAAGAVEEAAYESAPDEDDAFLLADAQVAEIEYEEDDTEASEGVQDRQALLEASQDEKAEESIDGAGTVVATERESAEVGQPESTDANEIEYLLQGTAETGVSVRVTGILSENNQGETVVYEVEVLQDHENGLKAAQRLTVTAGEEIPPLTEGTEYVLVLEQIDLANMTAVLKEVNDE